MSTSRRSLFRAAGIAAVATTVSGVAAPAIAATPADGSPRRAGNTILTGADVAAADGWAIFAGRRVGIITNPTGVLHDFTSIVDDMVAQGVSVEAVFGPEHGFRGTAQAGSPHRRHRL